jgi:hypothetical protein
VRIGPLATPSLALRLAVSQTVRLARLGARALGVRLERSGEVSLDGGRVEQQLAVSDRFDAVIAGRGDVSSSGTPRTKQPVSGSGTARRSSGSKSAAPAKEP